MNEKGKKKIGIFYPEGKTDTVPCLMSLIESLAINGYEVDIFSINDKKYKKPSFTNKGIKTYLVNLKYPHLMYQLWMLYLPIWSAFVIKRAVKKEYLCFIGVDPMGLITAASAGFIKKIPIIYLSLEIYIPGERKLMGIRLLKCIERWCNKRTWFTIVQDKNRAQLLMRVNRISNDDQIVLLPNSSRGIAKKKRSNYLREKFSIDKNKKIILYAGSIAKWAMCLELVQAFLKLPDDYVLVMHSRRKLGNDGYSIEIKKYVDGRRIILSEEAVPFCELDELISSADIGVALYEQGSDRSPNTNLRVMGLSSGKIAQYLKHGIPIITSDLPDLKELIDKYECGVYIKSPDELASSILKIIKAEDFYVSNAITCYNNMFNFDKYFEKVLQKIFLLK